MNRDTHHHVMPLALLLNPRIDGRLHHSANLGRDLDLLRSVFVEILVDGVVRVIDRLSIPEFGKKLIELIAGKLLDVQNVLDTFDGLEGFRIKIPADVAGLVVPGQRELDGLRVCGAELDFVATHTSFDRYEVVEFREVLRVDDVVKEDLNVIPLSAAGGDDDVFAGNTKVDDGGDHPLHRT